jgi:hypothetical protein
MDQMADSLPPAGGLRNRRFCRGQDTRPTRTAWPALPTRDGFPSRGFPRIPIAGAPRCHSAFRTGHSNRSANLRPDVRALNRLSVPGRSISSGMPSLTAGSSLAPSGSARRISQTQQRASWSTAARDRPPSARGIHWTQGHVYAWCTCRS